MADITKRQSGGYDREIVLELISQNNPNRKVADDHVPEKQLIDAADAEVTDEDEVPELMSAEAAEVSNHDVPEKQLIDAADAEVTDEDEVPELMSAEAAEVSNHDVPEKQLIDAADAEVTDEDEVPELMSAEAAEVSNHDVPEKQLNDANDDEVADDDVDAEVSDRDVVVPETQLNDADAKFADNVTAAEKDYFAKVVKILRHIYLSLSENVPRLRLGSMDYAYLAYRWCAFPIVANTYAMVTSLLEFLASAGGFFPMFFPVLIIIFFAALPVTMFLMSARIVVFIVKDLPTVLWGSLVKRSALAF